MAVKVHGVCLVSVSLALIACVALSGCADSPAVTEKPKAEAPKPDLAVVETGAEAPKTEPPKPETPVTETPKTPATDLTVAVPVKPDAPPVASDPNAPPAIKFSDDPDAPPPADIFAAAKGGDLKAVQQFVERDPATLQQKTGLSDTALHWASSCGHADIVKYLLSKGADPNLKNIAGATPLHLAARKAYVEVMAALIHSKANPNAKNFEEDGEETPLHIAIQKGNIEAIELLLKAGADPNARMTDGTRPLDIAEKAPTSDIRKLLVKYKGTSNATEEE